jgi:NitT/TauT family transport system substrate-binding protein
MGTQARWKTMTAAAVTAAVAACAFGAWRMLSAPSAPPAPPFPLVIAAPVQLGSGSVFLADQQQLFGAHGLKAEVRTFRLGKQGLQAVMDGKADFAVVADTPFMLAVLRGARIAAVATIFESRKTMALVARRDSGITDFAALDGKRVGTVLGTNAEFFLDTMLEVQGIGRERVRVIDLKPDSLNAGLRAGEVDAVTVWNPDLARLEQEFGARATTLYGQDLFVYRFLLVATQAYIDQHGPQVQQLLATLRQANDFIKDNPEPARAVLGKAIGLAPELLGPSFDPGDYTLVLDQSLLLALSAQTRWAREKGLVKPGPIPDYLDFVRPEPLRAVASDAVRIIR